MIFGPNIGSGPSFGACFSPITIFCTWESCKTSTEVLSGSYWEMQDYLHNNYCPKEIGQLFLFAWAVVTQSPSDTLLWSHSNQIFVCLDVYFFQCIPSETPFWCKFLWRFKSFICFKSFIFQGFFLDSWWLGVVSAWHFCHKYIHNFQVS